MKISQLPFPTLREVSADIELVSHRLMLRAALIRPLAAGIYTWLPLGLRVLRKVEDIVREEMERAGAQELLMPVLQPAALWQESGRWEQFGPELQRCQDRSGRDFCLGPTHEEVVTDLARHAFSSHRQLPVTLYQIQTKFRDELRPRFGVMRCREFVMKDAYSFHLDQACLQRGYQVMFDAYTRIFTRIGLHFRAVLADSGNIGGSLSHEFHVLAESGEDAIVFSDTGDYAANREHAEASAPERPRPAPAAELQYHDTPGQTSIAEVTASLRVASEQCVKTLIVHGRGNGLLALVLRGDHELNPARAEKLPDVASPLRFADEQEILEHTGCTPGYLGPVGLQLPIIADRAAAALADFVCGANQKDKHLSGVNWSRDLAEPQLADLRYVLPGEPAPDGGKLQVARGIEVGHIFQLGDKYSAAMGFSCTGSQGQQTRPLMGCYGIGISRIVAAAIEQNHDGRGIIWPQSIAPFQLLLAPVNMHKSERLRQAATCLYQQLQEQNMEVLLDDRKVRPGVMFTDAELLGIPHRLVISERSLETGQLEYCARRDGEVQHIPRDQAIDFLQSRFARESGLPGQPEIDQP